MEINALLAQRALSCSRKDNVQVKKNNEQQRTQYQ